MAEVLLKCRCGTVKGVAVDITANSGTRLVCCCDDCQEFARYLGCEDAVLDEYGGTDIYQTTFSQMKITEGAEQIRCVRLSPKGLFRWYTACCKTPIGNTGSANMPLIGVIHNFMDDHGNRDRNLGSVRGHVHVKFAKGALPTHVKTTGFPLRVILRSICKLLVWKIRGLNKPSPFFDADGNPVSEPHILNSTEKN